MRSITRSSLACPRQRRGLSLTSQRWKSKAVSTASRWIFVALLRIDVISPLHQPLLSIGDAVGKELAAERRSSTLIPKASATRLACFITAQAAKMDMKIGVQLAEGRSGALGSSEGEQLTSIQERRARQKCHHEHPLGRKVEHRARDDDVWGNFRDYVGDVVHQPRLAREILSSLRAEGKNSERLRRVLIRQSITTRYGRVSEPSPEGTLSPATREKSSYAVQPLKVECESL